MKILFITHYDSLYGANKSLLNLIDGLIKENENIEIIVLSPKGAVLNELKKRKLDLITIPFFNEVALLESKFIFIKGSIKFFLNWFITFYLFLKLRNKNINIIHTNSSATFLGAYLSLLLRKPHVWHIREYLKEDYNLKYPFGESYFRFWIKKASSIICISSSIAKKRFLKEDRSSIQIINNGVVFLNEITTRNDKTANFCLEIGVVGLISKEKNQMEALEAIKILSDQKKDISLSIIGDSNDQIYYNELISFIENNNLKSKVKLLGYQKNIEDFYKKLDVLIMCSKNEALGRVTIEAMAHSVLVVGFNNGGTTEIIKNKVNGLLYQNGSADLAEKLIEIIENKEQTKKFIENALVDVKEKYSIEKYAQKISKSYKDLMY